MCKARGILVRKSEALRAEPLPLSGQRPIEAEIEAERQLMEANRELIARMETKIAATLARNWGEDGQVAEKDPETLRVMSTGVS